MDFLKRIQNKSGETKARYAFVAAFSITLVITAVWITTLPAHLANTDIKNDIKESAVEVGSLSEVFKDAKNQVGNIIEYSLEGDTSSDTSNLDTLGSFNGTKEEETDSADEPRTVLIEVQKTDTVTDSDLETNDDLDSIE